MGPQPERLPLEFMLVTQGGSATCEAAERPSQPRRGDNSRFLDFSPIAWQSFKVASKSNVALENFTALEN